jgi:hypothetical protein
MGLSLLDAKPPRVIQNDGYSARDRCDFNLQSPGLFDETYPAASSRKTNRGKSADDTLDPFDTARQ